ncbi:MAG TPA: bifunctional hydroxymethylpyrimidine kinase/phosphomethylpyrimidine kinase [Rhizomicrobium sp.]
MKPAPARVLIIAGSDSSGGAGIQADIKTATALGAYAATAVTAVTVQDTVRIHAIHPVPASIVRDQIACVLDDIGADVIKVGMLGSADIVAAVADILQEKARGIPLVLDPVLTSTSGTPLLEETAISVLKERFLPLTMLLTPNIPEAEALARMYVRKTDEMRSAAEKLRMLGPQAVFIKGGHAEGETVEDILVWQGGVETFEFPRVHTSNTHGTGCTLATAIACGLANGMPLALAVRRARGFVQNALKDAHGFGRGYGPLNHLHGIVRD